VNGRTTGWLQGWRFGLSISAGFGGVNAAIVIRKFEE